MPTTEPRLSQPVHLCMTGTFITMDHRESVEQAARALRDRSIGLLLVTDGEELVGVLSERDVVTALADDDATWQVELADRARGDILTVRATAALQEAVDAMVAGGTRHLVVVDDDDQPVGVVSARDVLSELASTPA